MKKISQKRNLALAAAAILLLALCWYFTGNRPGQMKTAGRSPYQAAPLEQYAAKAEQEAYSGNVTEVRISIRNNGDTAHEFWHPILEGQKNGGWYSLKKEPEDTTSNLLYIEPGEARTYSLWTKSYGSLAPGRYRAVFPVWGSTDHIAAEFDIT